MKAMVLTHTGPIATKPLEFKDVPTPQPQAGEVRVKNCMRRVSYRSR